MQFKRTGIETVIDMNMPLLSKYCCRENEAHFWAAISFMLSEKYTSDSSTKNMNIWKLVKVRVKRMVTRMLTWKSSRPMISGSVISMLCRYELKSVIWFTSIRLGSSPIFKDSLLRVCGCVCDITDSKNILKMRKLYDNLYVKKNTRNRKFDRSAQVRKKWVPFSFQTNTK